MTLEDRTSSLARRAAWLCYVEGKTQVEVARHLGLSRIKVTRLIALAHRIGAVKVFVEGVPAECIALETVLKQRFGLRFCHVAPCSDAQIGTSELIRILGNAGAEFLHHQVEQNPKALVGIGHGRTLTAVAEALPKYARPKVTFVSLLGSLTRRATANPFDVINRLAERLGCEAYFVPAPFFADSEEDAAVLRSQKLVDAALGLAKKAELVLVGIGNLRNTPEIYEPERKSLAKLGIVAEILGQFLNADGKVVDCDMARRSISLRLDDFSGKEVVAIAGGMDKTDAITAVLNSGMLAGLVVDEPTAAALVEQNPVVDIRRPRHGRGGD
ncbi:MAG TPA: sugar-binding transcriptional regulator [Aliidongia sp.]|uniref:sugar-binding transcriptional regulator n=1 Tax=Aliidongia sp. TaxID=1914230 RepID=UPI002DDD5A76|nr:sugar-binding transcriptional regulator [Aliidongia sp.]HEV2677692.1 sugar-binding transcriptional regulator [Aliidongia sp.]